MKRPAVNINRSFICDRIFFQLAVLAALVVLLSGDAPQTQKPISTKRLESKVFAWFDDVTLTLHLSAPGQTPVTVLVRDRFGAQKVVFTGVLEAGEWYEVMIPRDLNAGDYVIEVVSGVAAGRRSLHEFTVPRGGQTVLAAFRGEDFLFTHNSQILVMDLCLRVQPT